MGKHHSWQRALILSANIVLLLCLSSSGLLFSTHSRALSATSSVFYDFVDQAASASWSSGVGSLPFPGSDSDSRGFALYRNNWQFEDNSIWVKCLQTHPQWVSDGWIMGVYPQMTVPSDGELEVTVGFLKGATGSDGVIFEVRFEEFLGLTVAPQIHSILVRGATYDGELDSLTAELSSLEGKTGNFVLYVNAGQSSGQDWAAWAEAKIECLTDISPPQIISDPTVSQITETSAHICWETDEVSNSLVKYDCLSGIYGSVVEDSSSVVEHCLSLTQLEPATTYHFVVESTDPSGNNVAGRDLSFETLSSRDGEEPSVSLIIPDTLWGKVPISADVQDNVGVEGVVFFIDGKPVHTDYSYPFEWECDAEEYGGGTHEFGAQASDFAGNFAEDTQEGFIDIPSDTSAPMVKILNPGREEAVHGTVPIEVQVQDNEGIGKIELYIDGNCTYGEVYRAGPRIDPLTGDVVSGLPKSRAITWPWGTNSLVMRSEHWIEVKAYDGSDPPLIGRDSLGVTIAAYEMPDPEAIYEMPPSFELRRNVERHDNYFEVTLEVGNTGWKTVSSLVVQDKARGFQFLQGEDLSYVWYVWYNPSLRSSTVQIFYREDLDPGDTVSFKYYAIPILFDPYSLSDYAIGFPGTHLECTADGDRYPFDFYLPCVPMVDEELDVEAAFHSADYLIVTNPYNLFATSSNYTAVYRLLCTMADLAKEKLGVLGYLYAPASLRTTLDGNDALALGDIDNDNKDEIVIGRVGGDEEGWVDIYELTGWARNLWTHLNRSEGFAVGDVLGDGAEDIVTVEVYSGSSKLLAVHNMSGAELGWTTFGSGERNFCCGDVVLLGDVVGDSKEEVVLGVEGEGVFVCYYDSTGDRWLTTNTWFEDGDAVAVGDVWGDDKEEIMVAKHGDNSVHGFSVVLDAGELHLGGAWPIPSTCYGSGDALAVGDINGDSKEEVVVADRDSGRVEVYQYAIGPSSLLFSVDTSFDRGDVLAVGRVSGGSDALEEIIIAEDGGETRGWVYVYGYYGDYVPCTVTSFGTAFDGQDYFLIGDVIGSTACEEIVIGNRGGSSTGYVEIISVPQGFPRDRYRLQELIQKDGDWNIRLCADWSDHGYLLLVGETEIIPAWSKDWWRRDINCTDYPYASTYGQDKFPELCIGRIIGNTAADLAIPIQNSLDVSRGLADFERNSAAGADAYALSGTGDYEYWFWRMIDEYMAGRINDEFELSKSRGDHLSSIPDNFAGETMDKDVIVYCGHGYDDGSGWAWHGGTSLVYSVSNSGFGYWDASRTWQSIAVDFGTARPFIFSLSCASGRYAGITGIAESLLRLAGVYIGATETSYTYSNRKGGDKFFEKWIGHPDKTIGQAWKETRHAASDQAVGECRIYWGAEYQLYGDPKFGAVR